MLSTGALAVMALLLAITALVLGRYLSGKT
jgi:hypothetical protein